MKASNVPDSSFPEIKSPLQLRLDSPRLAKRARPRLPVKVREVKQVRIVMRPDRRGVILAPQYKTETWGHFFAGDELVSTLIRHHRVGSFEFSGVLRNRVKRLSKMWKKWLQDWIKENHSSATFERPTKPVKMTKEKFKKEVEEKEEEIVLPKEIAKAVDDLSDLAFDEELSFDE